jgi:16S rRNA processing protein RimM
VDTVVTKSPDEYIPVGKVGATYGIKGWVKIHSFTEWVGSIFDFTPWYLEDAHGWQLTKVSDGREHGKGLIAKFNGFDNPEQSRLLTGKVIAIKRSQLPRLEKNEFYWSDLEGLTVIDQSGKVLGTVLYILDTGANDVLIIKNDKEYAIPYLPGSVILSVDLEKREIHVDWELI